MTSQSERQQHLSPGAWTKAQQRKQHAAKLAMNRARSRAAVGTRSSTLPILSLELLDESDEMDDSGESTSVCESSKPEASSSSSTSDGSSDETVGDDDTPGESDEDDEREGEGGYDENEEEVSGDNSEDQAGGEDIEDVSFICLLQILYPSAPSTRVHASPLPSHKRKWQFLPCQSEDEEEEEEEENDSDRDFIVAEEADAHRPARRRIGTEDSCSDYTPEDEDMESSSSGSSITGTGFCGEDEVEDEGTSETSDSHGLSDDKAESSESVKPTMLRRLRRRGVDEQSGSCDVSAPSTPVRVSLRPFVNGMQQESTLVSVGAAPALCYSRVSSYTLNRLTKNLHTTTSSDCASGVEEQKVVKLLICRRVAYNRFNHILCKFIGRDHLSLSRYRKKIELLN